MKVKYIVAGVVVLALAGVGGGAAFKWKEKQDAEQQAVLWEQLRQEPLRLSSYEKPLVPVDFDEWQNINPEMYAWITIPGTSIDAPVLQSDTDDGYYLTHSPEKLESPDGSIFSENYNKKDFSDSHTVLYGQNGADGGGFADLHRFGDESFFDEHKTIAIFTPDAIRYYQIFAAYLYDNRHLLQTYDCENPAIFEAYIKQILEQRNLYSQIEPDIQIGSEDRLLTLSTGHSKGAEYRYLVQAVLTEEREVENRQE